MASGQLCRRKRNIKVYRERKKKGLCQSCNKKNVNGLYCKEHWEKAKKRAREYLRKRHNIPSEKYKIKD